MTAPAMPLWSPYVREAFGKVISVAGVHPFLRRRLPGDAILCPEQVGKTEGCSTSALCWQSKRRIAFLEHPMTLAQLCEQICEEFGG
jgi:hypothetical protein